MRLTVRKSITLRLTLLFASASSIVLLLLGFLIAVSVDQHFEAQDMEVLSGKLKLTQHALEKIRSKAELDQLPQLLEDALVGHQGLELVVVAPDETILYATNGAEFPKTLLDSHVNADSTRPIVWRTSSNQPLRGISALSPTAIKGSPSAIVAVATNISHHEHFMSSFRVTLWSFVILAAFVTGVLGWIAARRGLSPLQAVKHKAADITAHRLDSRLPVDSVPVELLGLVETLNEMLTRLENSFKQLSDFSSDIAHELRTPVSNLLTQTQVTLSKDRSTDEYRDVLASNIEEFERLSRMISDMLFLAKSENNLIIPHREQLNLLDEVNGLFQFYEILAEDKSIFMASSGSGRVSGDRLMLRRAISNLLSNALRHTPAGGRIAVHVDNTSDSFVKLSVVNTGAAIPAEHVPRLFDRFYRVDCSRQRFSEGVGLGLAITRSIMRAHGGDAFVRSDQTSTVFELIVPCQPIGMVPIDN
ncbi:MAG: heavy metal sensor histidine kinase [Propionivibrio sp.]|uniref:Sensor protein n=1 Tax=Candidatus Propionivibrio dominans TaxID=2954373 RepID=A0A9D7FC79_9RHOO|nr:heavy metal sensor histidine kinase [Candidatus Propionivibrio dominans]MBK8358513.1 heavy metal sensor histidine kinase [Comamonadaceae bacterium]